MLGWIKETLRTRWLQKHRIDDEIWLPLLTMPLLRGLTAAEQEMLRDQAAWFLRGRAIIGVEGIEITDPMRVIIAIQAVLPTLYLGFEAHADWQEIIVYPSRFISRERHQDRDGIVHEYERVLAGEARSDGPVLLSWHDVMQGPWLDGYNVVIHELAHKLDMMNGYPNGDPPLHHGMNRQDWQRAFSGAYQHLQHLARSGQPSVIDLYAAQEPAECFAVFSEYFFELPHLVRDDYPAVYAQLCQFYRQDPAQRLAQVSYRPFYADDEIPL